MKLFSSRLSSRLRSSPFGLPRRTVWWIAFACAALGILSGLNLVVVPALMGYVSWIVLGGLILLLLATR
jgi:hypothetical protein